MADQRDGTQGVEVDRKLEELSRRLGVVEQRLGIVARAGQVSEVVKPPVMEESRVVSVEELVRKRREMEADRERERNERERLERSRLADAARLVARVEVPAHPPTVPQPVQPVVRAGEHECVDEPVSVVMSPVPLAVKPPVAPERHEAVKSPVPPVVARVVSTAPVAPQAGGGFEWLIGGKLYAAAGAIILVIGVGMLLKLGLDRGWFAMPPMAKCLATAGFGLALVGLGEVFRKRWGVLASVGVSAAGIAVTFASAYAAYGWYELIGAPLAFVLMALTSAMGIGVALRGRSIAVAALALVAAYITPLTVGESDASPWVMPMYLTALLALGLVLSAWRPDPFRMLRQFTWWGTVAIGSLWLFKLEGGHPWVALAFLGMVWCAVHAALWFGARRLSESAALAWAPSSVQKRVTRPIVLSLATTAWTVTSGVLVVQSAAYGFALQAWMVPACAVVGTFALAMMLAGNLRVFQDAPETDAERLGAAMWMQSGAMLIAAVAMGVSDWTQVIAWLGMGLSAAAIGRWLRARSLDVYAVIVLSIAVVRLLVWESWQARVFAGGIPATELVLGLALGRWSVLMFAAGAAWCCAAWLMHRPSSVGGEVSTRRRMVVDLCVGVGLTTAYVGVLSRQAEGWGMLGAMGVLAAALLGMARFRVSLVLEAWGFVALGMASVMCGLVQLSGADAAVTTIGPVAITAWGWTLVWLGGAWMLAAWLVRPRAGIAGMEHARRMGVDICLGIGLTMVYMSVLSSETTAMSMAIGAGVLALAVMGAARQRGAALLEWWGFAVLMAASLFGVYAQLGGWTYATRSVGPLVFTSFSVVVAWLGCVWLAAMGLMRRPGTDDPDGVMRRTMRDGIMAIALPMLFMSVVSREAAGVVMVAGAGVLGAALAVTARVRRSTLLEVWGGMVLTVATGLGVRAQLVSTDGWSMSIGSVVVSNWSLVLLGLGAAWVIMAWVCAAFTRKEDWAGAVGAIGAATLAVMAAGLAHGTSLAWTCVFWAALAAALMAAQTRLAKYQVDRIGMGVLAAGTGLWVYWFLIERSWSSSGADAGALMHPGMWVALLMAGVMLGGGKWLLAGTVRRTSWAPGVMGIAVLAGLLVFGATTLEVDRSAGIWVPHDRTAQAAAVSIWWAVFAAGLLVMGFAMRVPVVRHIGLGLMSVAALKTMVYDLGQGGVAQEWRVASVIGLGLVMLGVSVAYAKVSRRLERREAVATET